MREINTDVCVLGGGAGGFGCIYSLVCADIKTVVVDKNPGFGGTAVYSGVSCFEPGVSLDGVHYEIAKRLQKIKNACMVAKTVNNGAFVGNPDKNDYEKYPWGLSVKADDDYKATLKRCRLYNGGDSSEYRRFQTDEEHLSKVMNEFVDRECLTKLFGYSYSEFYADKRELKYIVVSNGDEEIKISAKYFVDSTGNVILARSAGCQYSFGTESRSCYGEPSAPESGNDTVNGISYVFRIARTDDANHIDEIDENLICDDFDTVSCFNTYPNGDINVNMLPTVSSKEYFADDYSDKIGLNRVRSYFNFLQRKKGLKGYTIKKIFGSGERESYRIKGRYVLTENDIKLGIFNQNKKTGIIAVADHPMDIHAEGCGCSELEIPYGIPIDCALTQEYDNLIVACKGASFSHLAASSARLTRTVISFGEGVGEYLVELIKYHSRKYNIA